MPAAQSFDESEMRRIGGDQLCTVGQAIAATAMAKSSMSFPARSGAALMPPNSNDACGMARYLDAGTAACYGLSGGMVIMTGQSARQMPDSGAPFSKSPQRMPVSLELRYWYLPSK